MRRQRLIFSDHATSEMEKASLLQPVTREMVSETVFDGLRKAQRQGRKRYMVWQANRFYGKRNLRVVFEDTPWGCDILTVLWEGAYD